MSAPIHFISAGAGSGKTYSLTHKLEALLRDGEVSPAGVIATTFTRLAAGELRERVRGALVEAGQLGVANQMEQALIGTVNSVCGDLLRRFAFEAGMPPDQQVVEETQGNVLFYQAMEQALAEDKTLIREMNATCHRLQILNRQQQLNWRAEVKQVADAARANNRSPGDIRELGSASADQLLAHFPKTTRQDLDRLLLNAIEQALEEIDTEQDRTKVTRDYVSLITGIRAALYKGRATWPEWISLSKKMPAKASKPHAEPIADVARRYETHPGLQRDTRFFAEQVFRIAAASLDAYQELKTRKGLIDFVDQEQRLYGLLDHPVVQDTLRDELQLLMVDEFQDTSPIQLALFLKLSRLAQQVIWVGDIKQSIYGFRGSDPTLMAAVVRRVIEEGNPPEILPKSWRSTPELVAYVNNLFTPAFANSLEPEQVALEPARDSFPGEPAVELWQLSGARGLRAQALACALRGMVDEGRTVVDKESGVTRDLRHGDIAVLCRTHDNLAAIAAALSAAGVPIRYSRPGLLATPEGCLAMACLRRIIDPSDTLASAEILALTECEHPEDWIARRMDYLADTDAHSRQWLEEDERSPVAALKAQRERLHFLTPVEALRTALDAGNVRESVYRWGPTEQRSQHRLNNLAALLDHAANYMDQCTAQHAPATSAGLVLWLYQLADAEEDTQATGGTEDAVQLVTHHGAKGLEWPLVIAMDLASDLRPRLWGLSVQPARAAISLDDPLADRTLRYWPTFIGQQKTGIPLLERIADSEEGRQAMAEEIEESKRLLYVSLTRPRDGLVIALDEKKTTGAWMDTLQADWMLPAGDTLTLPDGTSLPARATRLEALEQTGSSPKFKPRWLKTNAPKEDRVPLRVSPSSADAAEDARIGDVLELGERLAIDGEYDPATLGSALHAVIASTVLGHNDTERVLRDHQLENTISVDAADECARRLLHVVGERFQPQRVYAEHPVQYCNTAGQLVSGWIDLLLETEQGFVVIDHKASPRARTDWEEIALGYSGQLEAYAQGVTLATGAPVLSRWIHFGVTGGLVEVRSD
jgi:ATP-dependent exoDNAse (exonuclease V) beta subunit